MAIITNVNINAGVSNGGATPDWCPPGIIYKDADEIYVPKGRYYKAGHRFNGQYQNLSNMADYWDVAAQFAVDIDAAYSAGSTSGMVGGKVNSSWYSVFMVGSDELVVLPYIRVDTISYSSPSTTIAPAAHADGTTAENGFVTSNDQFNGYRLVLINDDPTESGNVYTIADCATGSPDSIVITGDVTGTIAATECLQMIPPDGTPFVFLGTVFFDGSGNLLKFYRHGWDVWWDARITINGTLSTDPGNVGTMTAIPPTASRAQIDVYCSHTDGSNVAALLVNLYRGTSGTNTGLQFLERTPAGTTDRSLGASCLFPITAVGYIRNVFQRQTTGWVAANQGELRIGGYRE